MINVQLVSLYLENFKSFLQPTYIEFKEGALTLLSGFNQSTGGSSAAGKTSLIEALAFNLGYCSLSFAQLKTWGTDAPPKTIGIYQCNQKQLKIERSHKLRVWIDNIEEEGNVSHKQKIVETLIGCNLEILELLTYHPQRKSGAFLDQNDNDKKEFLTKVLGLELFEEAVRDTEIAIYQKQREKGLSWSEFQMYEAQYASMREQKFLEKVSIKTLSDYESELHNVHEMMEFLNKKIPRLENEIEIAKKRFEDHTARYALQLEYEENHRILNDAYACALKEQEAKLASIYEQLEFQKKEANVLELHFKNYLKQKNSISELDQKIIEKRLLIDSFYDQLIQKKRELEDLKNATCFVCKSPIDEQITELRASKIEEISVLQNKIEIQTQFQIDQITQVEEFKYIVPPNETQLLETHAKVSELEAQRTHLEVELKYIKSQGISSLNVRNFSQYQEIFDKIKSLEAALLHEKTLYQNEQLNRQHELKMAQQEFSFLQQQEKDVCVKIKNIEKTNEEIDAHNQEIKNRLEKTQIDLEARIKKRDEIEKTLLKETEFLSLINYQGFLGFIFDEFLEQVSLLANDYLARIPNVNFITVQFVSEILTQKGVAKRNIKPIFFTNHGQINSWRYFSGGQMSSIDLAIGLALNKIISERMELSPGWLILDEVFEGQDIVTKEVCLELIKEFSKDKMVIVVDHASEFKEMFEHQIMVISENGKSYLENK